jgi:hypothetical protein
MHDTCLPNCSIAAKAFYSTDDKKGNEENMWSLEHLQERNKKLESNLKIRV